MSKRNMTLWQLIGFIFTSVIGTLLHFLYDWTGKSIWSAPFSATNESIWEHMKLIFVPMFIFAIIENIYLKEKYSCFWKIKLKGILLALLLIPVIYYTYNGAFGKSPDWLNIAIFFITAAIVYIYETRLFNENMYCKCNTVSIITLCLIAVLFIIFTFTPPHIPLFADPTTGLYGMQTQ